jgi:uncharacterized membrane protein
VPVALIALVLLPAVAGSPRLVEVFGGPRMLPANPGLIASPVPVVVHIVCAVAYTVLGAFQFSAGLRRRRPGWHRAAGRVLVALGLAVAFSALWLTLFSHRPEGAGELLLYVSRLAVGSAVAAGVILGFTAIRRGDVARHRAWMTRAYALGLGAGTQVFTLGRYPPATGSGWTATSTTTGRPGSVTSPWPTTATGPRASAVSSRTRRSCTVCWSRSETSASS